MHFLKLYLFSIAIFFLYLQPKAQDSTNETNEDSSNWHLSVSSGIDNHSGILGLGALIPFSDMVGLRIGTGIGSWGIVLNGGIKIQNLNKNGMGIGLGYSYHHGWLMRDINTLDQNGNPYQFDIELNPVSSINLTINKNWVLTENMLIYIESGYAFLTRDNDLYNSSDGTLLTREREHLLYLFRPSGVIMAMGVLVAF